MSRAKPIQLHIPDPCTEDWNNMSPTDKGRFCSHCQKSVIDFTGLSDNAVYEYVSKHEKEHICGRFYSTQLNRPINIPPQPHSRLYRHFVGLGLTLMATVSPVADLYAKTSTAQLDPPYNPNNQKDTTETGTLRGQILDEKKEPIVGAVIQITQGGLPKGGIATDAEGKFYIKDLPVGRYWLKVSYASYFPNLTEIEIQKGQNMRDFQLKLNTNDKEEVAITMGNIPHRPTVTQRIWSKIKSWFN